jgi:peptidoglycan/LPS O-acetylase OafA/YrhL
MQSSTQGEQVQLRRKTYLPSINGGRAIAMFMVFGGHFLSMQFSTANANVGNLYAASVPGRGASDQFFNNFFNFFVPVPMDYFFIISGFVLAWAYRPGTPSTRFWRRRFGKIYPIYFVCELAAFLLFGVLFANWTSWKVVLTHIFMLQSWTPGSAYSLGLDPALWTLSSEAFNYLFFPALMILLLMASKRGLKVVALAMTGLTFLLPWLVTTNFTLYAPPSVTGAPLAGYSSEFTQWFTVYCPIPRLFQFTLGMTLALMIKKGVRFRINVPVAALLSLGALFLTNFYLPIELSANAGMLIPLALLIVALAQADQKGKRTGLRSRVMQFFGRISYCFYAVHILFVIFTVVQIPVASGAWDFPRLWLYKLGAISSPKIALPSWANVLLFLLYLGASILAAWALNVFVERPLNRVIRGGSPRPGQGAGPVALPDLAEAPVLSDVALASASASASAEPAFAAPVSQLDPAVVRADDTQAGRLHFPDTKAS